MWHIPIIVATFITIIFGFKWFSRKRLIEKLIDLNDCPFKFTVKSKHGTDYAVFDLGENSTLWVEFTFGIRSDGLYGVNQLEVHGLNSPHGSTIELAVGQSVFPAIKSVNEFTEWARKKVFEYYWEKDFLAAWEAMKKKLDNLRFFESKLKKEKK
ncbi:MAG: hypothetical protein ACREBR_04730 [bacterium]